MVPKVETAADIGCDHGKVTVDIIKKGKAKRVICSDISGMSLDKATKLVNAKNLLPLVSLRVGNGLGVLKPGEADAAIIAGMGGELIAEILEKGGERVPDILILSCNTASGLLRSWLDNNGFAIENEEMVFEARHFYPVILARRGEHKKLSDIELEFGPVLLKNKPRVMREFLKKRVDATIDIRKKLEKANKENKEVLLAQIDKQLEKYREVEKCLQQ